MLLAGDRVTLAVLGPGDLDITEVPAWACMIERAVEVGTGTYEVTSLTSPTAAPVVCKQGSRVQIPLAPPGKTF